MTDRAAYASDPTLTRGRQYPTNASPTRSEYQRDRDRIIHSTAFRRLQHKTQVFLHHEGQHFRTRLTHTLEVSQMARSIARALRLDEDLAEAIALAHDLGHTPFGHAGERVLHEKMQPWGGFDHNVQAMRVVTLLESRYAEHDGLNLTWETLEGILKHNGPLVDAVGRPLNDAPLTDSLASICTQLSLDLRYHASLEAQVAAIADDIAYDAHDIDDALRAELINFEELASTPFVAPIVHEVRVRWPDIAPRRQAHEVQRRLITSSIENVITTSEAEILASGVQSADDVRHAGRTLIRFSSEVAEAEQGLKRFLFDNVYRSEAVMVPVRDSQQVVAALFDYYMQTGDMPGRWGEAARKASHEIAKARVVSDFIAGMTDPYSVTEFGRVFDGLGKFGYPAPFPA